MRVKEAADYLNVTPQTIRNWCNTGELAHGLSGAGQRVFTTKDLDEYKRKRLGLPEPDDSDSEVKVFYVRSSNKNDVTTQTQIDKLTSFYGDPKHVYKDNGSGLNDNRKNLNKLMDDVISSDYPMVIYVTNKDRLSRFGYKYLDKLFISHNAKIVVLDSDDTKEPLEVLMQDFMSLLASFSGKFYRLRGWEQRKKFLKDVTDEVNKHGV